MKITKFDIGAEIISILTKGMYPDPRDAVREYIQNAIDAKAKDLDVKVRQNSVVIEDTGVGMDFPTLRKAIRLGISDKRPGKDVGFMGIGIYSAFHLCDTLTIYTRRKKALPQTLKMDFKGMRTLLDAEKEKRLSKQIESDELTDLQTLLQSYIEIPDEGDVSEAEYPVKEGTRVELVGLSPILDDLLNNFDVVASYLRDVVPLHFDKSKFKWGSVIEEKINEVCRLRDATFEIINLKLQVGSRSEALFRPYTDELFNFSSPQSPQFFEITDSGIFYGVAWGCLNSYDTKVRIATKELRGFLLKKQGFSIGKREYLARYFGSTNSHFDRYTGEIIVTHPQILPNAARNDLEASALRTKLYLLIQQKVAPVYNVFSTKYQEQEKAKSVLKEEGNTLKQVLAEYNPSVDNYNTLLPLIQKCDSIIKNLDKRRLSNLDDSNKKEASKIVEKAEKMKREILLRFDQLVSKKKKRPKPDETGVDVKTEIAENLDEYNTDSEVVEYESLIEAVNSLDIDLGEDAKKLIALIDEKFIQSIATTKAHYNQLLNELRKDFETL